MPGVGRLASRLLIWDMQNEVQGLYWYFEVLKR